MHHGPHSGPEASPGRISRLPLLLLLCVAQLMVILDVTAVNVALPDMARDLGIGHADIGWTITKTKVTLLSTAMTFGRPSATAKPT